MIQEFYNDDPAYEYWLKNIGGYVYNDFGGSNVNYKKLHRSDCRMLHNVRSGQRKTSVRKICSSDLSGLKQYVSQKRGSEGIGYSLCAFCFFSANAPEGLSHERTHWTQEKYSSSSGNVALTIAQTLIHIYNLHKLPSYYNSFYLPLDLTKKEVEADPNRIYWMIVLAAYDRQPFTIVAKGWEAIWGTKQESDSIRVSLDELGLLNMKRVSALSRNEISSLLKSRKLRGYRIDSDGVNTDYARTITDASHVVKDRRLLDLLIEANTPEQVKAIFDLFDSVHGIGPTIASKLVMYTLREIGIGRISPRDLYRAVTPILKEYHNIKLVKELERAYGVGFVDAIFECLKKLNDPFAIDALYYIDREEPSLRRQLFQDDRIDRSIRY